MCRYPRHFRHLSGSFIGIFLDDELGEVIAPVF